MTTPQALALARQHHRAGRLGEAESFYREILAADPCATDALHFIGIIAGQTGRHAEAVAFISQAVALQPDHPEAQKNLGVALKAVGRDDDAIAAYRRAIAIKPDYAEAHKNLGNLLLGKGEIDQAIAAYREAIACAPGFAEAGSNLGAALRRAGRLDESVAACRGAIATQPAHAEAHSNLGNALFDLGDLDAAIASYRIAVQIAPTFATAWNHLGVALIARDNPSDAIAACQRAVELRPDYSDAFANLGHALRVQGRITESIAAYRQATVLKPHSPDWRHVLAALSGDSSQTTTPASYVRKLFDPYAAEFDAHLTGQLQYRVPELLLDAVLTTSPDTKFEILDLGCGTGLCGNQFRSIATRLVGVDLSPAMIAKAAARKIYDELITAEISEAMRERHDNFDLILAGDLFIYVGDLSDTFRSAAWLLRKDGLFAFSLEQYDGDGFALTSKVRFAHSLAYIRGLSRDHGFTELHIREIAIRKSGPDEIPGWISVLKKTSACKHSH